MQLAHIVNASDISQGKKSVFVNPINAEYTVNIVNVKIRLVSEFIGLVVTEGLNPNNIWVQIDRRYANNQPFTLDFTGFNKVRFTVQARYSTAAVGGTLNPLTLTIQEVA